MSESANPSLFVCGISGETPEEPVVSPVSGAIFEKRLISKWIQENGTDPVNDAQLDTDQLIEVRPESIVRPKAPNHTSIPAILKALQDETDSIMLNNYSQRTQLQTTRQELSHALYQHDAACRVIARLQKETNATREALATLKPSQAQVPHELDHVEADSEVVEGLSDEVKAKIEEQNAALTKGRKELVTKRKAALCGVEKLHNYTTQKTVKDLHEAGKQIVCMDMSKLDNTKIVTGSESNVVVYDTNAAAVVSKFDGHKGAVSKVVYHTSKDVVFSASEDSTVRVWSLEGGAGTTIKAHKAAVTGIALHPLGSYILSSSKDHSWAFSDIESGNVLTKATESEAKLESSDFHPDGLFFGVGTSTGGVKIWDIRNRVEVAPFGGHAGAVNALAFSENGYYVASAAAGNEIKIWDLRKLKEIKSIVMREDDYVVNALKFDPSGQYLGAAGQDLRLYMAKTWAEVTCYSSHEDDITGLVFGENCSTLGTCSRDSTVRLYGDAEAAAMES